MSNRRRLAPVLAVSAAAIILSAMFEARADGEYTSPTDDRVRLSLGVMDVSSMTTLESDSRAGLAGSQLEGERQLGLPKSAVEPKFEAAVRMGTRSRLSFDYFTLDRTGNTTVTGAPIFFRNVVFQPGDPLQTHLSLSTFGLTYGYSFWHSETLEIAATLGVHITDISATAKVQTLAQHIIQNEDRAGPIPTPGLQATWVASERFYLDSHFQYLSAHYQNVGGSLGLYNLDLLYRLRPNVSLALGYTFVKAKLASTDAGNAGLFEFDTKGPEFFIRVGF